MNDTVILVFGIITVVLFLIGYGLTIKEFRGLKDEPEEESFPEQSNAKIKK